MWSWISFHQHVLIKAGNLPNACKKLHKFLRDDLDDNCFREKFKVANYYDIDKIAGKADCKECKSFPYVYGEVGYVFNRDEFIIKMKKQNLIIF